MRAALLFPVGLTLACGTTEGESMADISWRFNYADPTDPTADDDFRACDNVRADNPGPAYPVVNEVRLALVDPDGLVRGIDVDYACELGSRGERVPIQGVVAQAYELTLEATSDDGTVLYRTREDNYSLETYREDELELEPATGEIHFFPRFNGMLDCPGDVVSFRTSMHRKVDGVIPDTPTLVLDHEPACEAGVSRQIFVRGLPVVLESSIETFNSYAMVLEALGAAGNTLHCGINRSRAVRLGDNSLGADEGVGPGTCPPL